MSKTEWFASWFDTSYYHTLYKKRDDNEAALFIKNLVANLDISPNAKVLDLACGKGRHSKTLHELGLDVLGVDLSPNSIQSASLNQKPGLRFKVQDMRSPLDEKFEVVFNLFTSFGYFDDISANDQVIRAIHTMLEKDGLVVIDFMNSHRVIENLVKHEQKEVDGISFNISRRYDGTHIFKDIRFEDKEIEHHYTERVQALKLNDFKTLLQQNGFEILSTFGDFNLIEFDAETADRLIIIAKKLK